MLCLWYDYVTLIIVGSFCVVGCVKVVFLVPVVNPVECPSEMFVFG